MCYVAREGTNNALIDSACPTTVAGVECVRRFVANMSESEKQLLKVETSSRVYKFGGGEKRQSKGTVVLPCTLDGKLEVKIKAEVIEAELPLLLGNTTLEKGFAVHYFYTQKLDLRGKTLDIKKTSSGHFSVSIQPSVNSQNITKMEDTVCLAVAASSAMELTEEKVKQLHQYWGHCKVEKLGSIIENAGRMTQSVKKHLQKLKETCESCRVIKNRKPRQVVSIPRAVRRNQIVTVDLKEWEDGRFIIYAIDMFMRFTVATFIKNKKAETISEALLSKWISMFGIMGTLHKDGGGEFNNE